MANIQEQIVKCLDKFGIDKALHCFLGGWITAIGLSYSFLIGIIAFILVIVFSFVKEYMIDKDGDFKDIVAGVLGGIISFIAYIPALLLL